MGGTGELPGEGLENGFHNTLITVIKQASFITYSTNTQTRTQNTSCKRVQKTKNKSLKLLGRGQWPVGVHRSGVL